MSPIEAQNKTIGENIKIARKAQGITQRALAEKLGIAFQNLSVWENGKGAPSVQYLMKLSEVLNVSLDQIVSPDGVKVSIENVFPSEGKFIGIENTVIHETFEAELPRIIQDGVADSSSVKLVVRYLEEIKEILKKR